MPHLFNKKLLTGIVCKKSGNKTVAVEHTFTYKHKKYCKIIKMKRKYLVHDENNKCEIGDRIYFSYYRPISCRKFYTFYKKIL